MSMNATLYKIDDETHKIIWDDDGDYGEILFIWNKELGRFIVDSEHLGVESIIKIIQGIDI